MRWGKPTKNKKRRDPRYFLTEQMNTTVQNAMGSLYLPLLSRSGEDAIQFEKLLVEDGVDIGVLVQKFETLAHGKWANDIVNAVQESMKKNLP